MTQTYTVHLVHFISSSEEIKNLAKVAKACREFSTLPNNNYKLRCIHTVVGDTNKIPLVDDFLTHSEFRSGTLSNKLKDHYFGYPFANDFGKRKQDIIERYKKLTEGKENQFLLFLDGDEVLYTSSFVSLYQRFFYFLLHNSCPIFGFARNNIINGVGKEDLEILRELKACDQGEKSAELQSRSTKHIPDSMKEASLIGWRYPDIQQRMVRLDVYGHYLVYGKTHEKIFYVCGIHSSIDTQILWGVDIVHVKTVTKLCELDKTHNKVLVDEMKEKGNQ